MGKIKLKCHFGLQKARVHDLVRGESQEQEEEKEEEGRGEEDQGMESLFLGFDLNPKVLVWRLVLLWSWFCAKST